MRMLMEVKLPLEPFNTAVRNGTAGWIAGKILEAVKPEAAYFTERDGCRGGTKRAESGQGGAASPLPCRAGTPR